MDPSRPKSGVLMGSPVQISSLLVSDGSSYLNYISFTKKNWPNASTLPPKSSRSICGSSLLHFGGCFELWFLYRWNVHANWWEIIGSELARCTSNNREGSFGAKTWVILFVFTRGGCYAEFFVWRVLGHKRLWIICLFVCLFVRAWSGVVIHDSALGSHQSQGLKVLSIMEMVGAFIASQWACTSGVQGW